MGYMARKPTGSDTLTLVFTCVGRRIELLQAFRAAARRLGVRMRLVGVDSNSTAPGLSCVDEAVVVPQAADAAYIARLMDAVKHYQANALIPTTDTDLSVISGNREAFAAVGCVALIAEPQVIAVCRDKRKTERFLREHGIDTPRSYTRAKLDADNPPPLPLFCKPLSGSASQRVRKINDRLDLDYYLRRDDDLIVQEFIDGREYTLDVYTGLDGTVRCVVPRARWQVRTGEVVKGVVVKDLEIMNAGRRVVEALGQSPRGLVTLQCIVTPERRICFIEINPRFGGGAPLGIAAGADYPAWLLQELSGQAPQIAFDGFRHGLCMLRYDWSVFLQLQDDLKPRVTKPLRDWPTFE